MKLEYREYHQGTGRTRKLQTESPCKSNHFAKLELYYLKISTVLLEYRFVPLLMEVSFRSSSKLHPDGKFQSTKPDFNTTFKYIDVIAAASSECILDILELPHCQVHGEAEFEVTDASENPQGSFESGLCHVAP